VTDPGVFGEDGRDTVSSGGDSPTMAAACSAARSAWLRASLERRGGVVDPSIADHLARCPVCRERMDQLGAAVLDGAADDLSCAETRRRLPAVFLSTDFASSLAADTPLARHIQRCPECADEFGEVAAALRDLAAGRLEPAARRPSIDLRFLDEGQHASRRRILPWLSHTRVAAAGHGTVVFAVTIVAALVLCVSGALWLASTGSWSRWSGDPRGVTGETALGPAGRFGTPERPATFVARQDSGHMPTSVAATRVAQRAALARTAIAVGRTTQSAAASGTQAARAASSTQVARRLATAAAEMAAMSTLPPATATETASPLPPVPSAPAEEDDPGGRDGSVAVPPLVERCTASRSGELDYDLPAPCPGLFPNRSQYDRYRVLVAQRGRWSFATCSGTPIDTILAIYTADRFDPSTPCRGVLAMDDDGCGRQSKIELLLEPGAYDLLVLEKSGDAPPSYMLTVSASSRDAPCPARVVPPPALSPTSSTTPSATSTSTAGPEETPQATATTVADALEARSSRGR
jgi:predicted anti-sigma-YlaC factor YlaD